ncbi:WecB/TagA/CpsF family glycosyltransferase [Pseudoxanthomonas putridarboris]|uniref:WecB/TagA/CpsF family glycosyltransferase n=1 Tax=Pseudoxanthomonas putridarboris TaxID=752605 RepID=A0ABU9IWS1_9GAMM
MSATDTERTRAEPAAANPQPIWLGGYPIHSPTREQLADELLEAVASGRKRQVFFANTNFVVQCQPLRARLRAPSVRVVNDGIGMDLAARLVHGRRFAENLNGTDFIPYLSARSPRPLRFFLLGSRPGVAAQAARHMVRALGQEVVGTCDGYAEYAAAGNGLVDRINASGADVVLVAFGNPAQEAWILDHCAACTAPAMFGVGALLDFLSGNARRAPPWMRSLHLEWLFRLMCEPRRLLKRYTWDLAGFFRICLRAGKSP